MNNFIFDLVLKTATPIILLLLLSVLQRQAEKAAKKAAKGSGRSEFGVSLADACSDLWIYIIFLVYPSCSTMIFTYFMRETYKGPGEVYVDLMRADRSINREEPLYQSFTVYAIIMLVIYPIGVPLFYALTFYRGRHELHDLRRIELTLETDFALTKLKAEAAATPEETDELVRRAIEVHQVSGEALKKLRDKLPSTLRKLTAGYELRTYWFEIFECLRKITLIGLPIFFPPGSPPQLIFGLIICFLSYGAFIFYSPYIRDDDNFLAQVSQVIIFFSLVSSVVTNAFPEDPVMQVLLPALLAVPMILSFIFETPLLMYLRKFTESKDGSVGKFILARRRHAVEIADRLVGAAAPKMRGAEVLQAGGDLPPPTLHMLVRVADEASQETTTAFAAAARTAACKVNETQSMAEVMAEVADEAAAAEVADEAAADKAVAEKAAKAAKADKAVMSHLPQLDPTAPWQLLDSGDLEAAAAASAEEEARAQASAATTLQAARRGRAARCEIVAHGIEMQAQMRGAEVLHGRAAGRGGAPWEGYM